jgi:hypothetical protein
MNQWWLWVDSPEQEPDLYYLKVLISRWSFIQDIQFKFGTNEKSFVIPLKIVWRDGAGSEILSESFNIELNDISGQESTCKAFYVTKLTETRDYMFAMEPWKLYDSMPGMEDEKRQKLWIDQTLDIYHDYSSATS